MKKLKSYLNKLCVVRWADAHSETRCNLQEFTDKGAETFTAVGWIYSVKKGGIVIVSEYSENDENLVDATYIPSGMILSIKEQGGQDVDSN